MYNRIRCCQNFDAKNGVSEYGIFCQRLDIPFHSISGQGHDNSYLQGVDLFMVYLSTTLGLFSIISNNQTTSVVISNSGFNDIWMVYGPWLVGYASNSSYTTGNYSLTIQNATFSNNLVPTSILSIDSTRIGFTTIPVDFHIYI